MSFGLGGGSHSERSTSTTTQTTPWTDIAKSLGPTLQSSLKSLGSGSSITEGVKAIGDVFKRSTKEGIANIKEAYGKSGLRMSTDTGKAIGDFSTGQATSEAMTVAQFQQGAVQNQLAALQEIISLASGSGTSTSTGHQWGDQFGWNFAMKLLPKMA